MCMHAQNMLHTLPMLPSMHAVALPLTWCHVTLQARLEPVSLQSFQPPLAKQFAAKQLSLMQSMIMSEKAAGNQAPNAAAIESKAFSEAEAHFKQQITALRR